MPLQHYQFFIKIFVSRYDCYVFSDKNSSSCHFPDWEVRECARGELIHLRLLSTLALVQTERFKVTSSKICRTCLQDAPPPPPTRNNIIFKKLSHFRPLFLFIFVFSTPFLIQLIINKIADDRI